jgi:phosphoribosylanthranilate isomerase
MTWIKICGTTNLHDAELCVRAGADALGFIFAPSPRAIDVDTAGEIFSRFAGKFESIGVFVNQTPCMVADVAHQAGLTGVQLHGDEAAESLPEFRRALGKRRIVKVLHANDLLSGSTELAAYLAARDSLDAILLDSGSAEQRGGTGEAYDWEQLLPIARRIRDAMPLMIAGGLNATNVARAIARFDPWGIDVVSGVESRPGEKDETRVKEFVAAVRQTEVSVEQGN